MSHLQSPNNPLSLSEASVNHKIFLVCQYVPSLYVAPGGKHHLYLPAQPHILRYRIFAEVQLKEHSFRRVLISLAHEAPTTPRRDLGELKIENATTTCARNVVSWDTVVTLATWS